MSKRGHASAAASKEDSLKTSELTTVQDQGNVRLIEFAMTYSDEEGEGKPASKKAKSTPKKQEQPVQETQVQEEEQQEGDEVTEVAQHQEIVEDDLDPRIAEIVGQSELHGVEPGQHYLQIVDDEEGGIATQIVDGATLAQNNGTTVVQGDQFVEIDLMNIRLIRYEGEDCAQEVITDGSEMDGVVVTTTEDGQEQRYLHLNGMEENELSEQVTVLQEDGDQLPRHGRSGTSYQYVQVVEKDSVPMVYYMNTPPNPPMPNSRIIQMPRSSTRKRRDFPLTVEMMESPKFKLFLYNCKHCDFKCNAIKELTAHRQVHQMSGQSRFRSFPKPPPTTVQNIPPSPEPEEPPVSRYSSSSSREHSQRYHSGSKQDVGSKSERKLSILSSKHAPSVYHCEKCDLRTASRHTFKRHDCKAR